MNEEKDQMQDQAADAAPQPATEQTPAPAPDVAAERVAQLEAEAAKLKDQLLRALAETENTRRRLEQQAEDRGRYAVAAFARDMLGVSDNLRRALTAVPAEEREANELIKGLAVGVEMTERELQAAFEKQNIRRIEALGEKFDPNLHQAMMEVEDPTKPSGTVVMVMAEGYTIHDRLLRAAMVAVSRGGPKGQPGEGEQRVDTTV
ncbi:MAG: nucleotide exchange factor GrpE [Alphaproteobacteria bacterium]|nr:nucleotide exchange factor GrpE [Alphaproteobacteria bacterium]